MLFVDSVILDMTERLCRAFQRLTGRTNVWLALQLTNLSIVVYFVWAALTFWREDTGTRMIVGVFCAGVLYALTQTIFRMSIEASEVQAFRRVANGLRNPRRIQDALLRVSFLMLTLVFAPLLVAVSLRVPVRGAVLTVLLIVLTTVVLYLLACDPLPPCAGKVTEWLRALASRPVGEPVVSDGTQPPPI